MFLYVSSVAPAYVGEQRLRPYLRRSGPGIYVRIAVHRKFEALSEIGPVENGLHRVNPLAFGDGLITWRSRLHVSSY